MGGMSSGRRLWAVLLIAMAFLSGAALGSTRPQVLVLASYHVGLAWTDGQTSTLKTSAGPMRCCFSAFQSSLISGQA